MDIDTDIQTTGGGGGGGVLDWVGSNTSLPGSRSRHKPKWIGFLNAQLLSFFFFLAL